MTARTSSTGVDYLDALLGGLIPGDNVAWQVDSGAPVEFFTQSFLKAAAATDSSIIFVSFSHSPQSIIRRYVSEDQMPLGAVAVYTFVQKLRVGLQQIMAGSRNFSLPSISRDDLIALTREASDVSGIPYVMEAGLEVAESILDS